MHTQIEKYKENSFPIKRMESRAVANDAQQKSKVEQGNTFVDNRSKVVRQIKLKELTNYSIAAQLKIERGKFNVIGERHDDYNGMNPRFPNGRLDERKFLKDRFGLDNYWTESEFKGIEKTTEGKSKRADPIIEHVRTQIIGLIKTIVDEQSYTHMFGCTVDKNVINGINRYWQSIYSGFLEFFGTELTQEGYEYQDKEFPVEPDEKIRLQQLFNLAKDADKEIEKLKTLKADEDHKLFKLTKKVNKNNQQKSIERIGVLLHQIDMGMGQVQYKIGDINTQDVLVDSTRETAMIKAADNASQQGYIGAWKIGNSHINNMQNENGPHKGTKGKQFTITTREDYWREFDANEQLLKTIRDIRKDCRSREDQQFDIMLLLGARDKI